MRHWVWMAMLACRGGDAEPPTTSSDTTPPDVTLDTVDTANRRVRETPWDCFGRGEVDVEGDGDVDYVVYEVYDSAAPDLLLHEEHDTRDDGRVEWIEDHAYDPAGNRIRTSLDDNGDGTWEQVETFAWDAGGRLLEQALDSDADGAADEVWTWVYDVDGNVAVEEFDADGDGSPDERREYVYAAGRLDLILEDIDADDVIDITYTHFYDPQDRLERVEGDAGDGPPPELQVWYTYAGPNDSYTRTMDEDGDGDIDETLVIGLDVEGRPVDQAFDFDGDGHFEAGWQGIVWDDDARFVAGRFFADLDPTGAISADVWDYDYGYTLPSGPWVDYRIVEHRNAFDGEVDSTFLSIYAWSCP